MSQVRKNSISYSLANVKLGAVDQIIGFEIDVSGGGFEGISSLPKGWRTAIDNNSAAETKLNADLAFGSETMGLADLKDIVITLSQIEGETKAFRIIGHLVVTNGSSERHVSLAGSNFVPRAS